MSSNTKIVVLKMKEIIYTALFVILGILLILLLVFMFLPKNDSTREVNTPISKYTAGVYSSSLTLGDASFDVEVCVDDNYIKSINLVNISESVTTMYPLVQPTLTSIESQIVSNQSLDNITYSDENRYTSIMLLDAISKAIEKATNK